MITYPLNDSSVVHSHCLDLPVEITVSGVLQNALTTTHLYIMVLYPDQSNEFLQLTELVPTKMHHYNFTQKVVLSKSNWPNGKYTVQLRLVKAVKSDVVEADSNLTTTNQHFVPISAATEYWLQQLKR